MKRSVQLDKGRGSLKRLYMITKRSIQLDGGRLVSLRRLKVSLSSNMSGIRMQERVAKLAIKVPHNIDAVATVARLSD